MSTTTSLIVDWRTDRAHILADRVRAHLEAGITLDVIRTWLAGAPVRVTYGKVAQDAVLALIGDAR